MLEQLFLVREMRYLSEVMGSNKLAELDVYLRKTKLRTPVLEVLDSDEFRVPLAEKVAHESSVLPLQVLPDLIADALAKRDFNKAIQLLEKENEQGAANQNDLFLLTYLYCLNGNVEKAETLAAHNGSAAKKDGLADWLWGKLQAEFGFRPPR